MTVDVYLAPASGPCRAVLMTAKYLGVDVRQKVVNLMTGDQLKPDFLKVRFFFPTGTVVLYCVIELQEPENLM